MEYNFKVAGLRKSIRNLLKELRDSGRTGKKLRITLGQGLAPKSGVTLKNTSTGCISNMERGKVSS